MKEIKRKIQVSITFTPEEVAEQFCHMDNLEQARFFNAIAVEVKKWDSPFCFQLQGVTSSTILTPEGRKVMEEIGDYAEPYKEQQP